MTDWTAGGNPSSTFVAGAPTKLDRGVMEFEAQFEGHAARFAGLSTTLRPDALSFDYQTAYTMGPVAIGDTSLGVLDRTWELRYHDGGYYYRRSNDANDGWDAEVLLFADARQPKEIDVAFDQQARIFVCAEIAGSPSHVWAYFFDTIALAYQFENLGEGATPRCVLDSPFDTTVSDVLVFYMNRTRGKLSYRQQRDRYLTEYDTPISDDLGETFVEDAARLSGYRVAVLHSVHDVIHGTYDLRELESGLYPARTPPDQFAPGLALQSGEMDVVVFVIAIETDQFGASLSLQSGSLVDATIFHTLYDVDQFKASLALQSGTLATPVIFHTLYDTDQFKAGLALQSGTLVVVIVLHSLYDLDQFKLASLALNSGTLV